MLNKIKRVLKKLKKWEPSFDASKFEDEIALKTEWAPLKGGGTNFKTHKLIMTNYTRCEFKSTAGSKMFSLLFLVVGLAVPVFIGRDIVNTTGVLLSKDFILTLLIGLIFLTAGGWLLYSFSKPVVFDKTKGMFWKGWKAPQRYLAKSADDSSRIGSIHALQIIPELVRGDNSSYVSYELNLILKDGSRMNVVDHGDINQIRTDAKSLSEFLGVPVWDGV